MSATTVSSLDGNFKKVYAGKLINLIPDNAVLIKKVPFKKKERIGASYEQPVVLANENGVTVAAAGSGAFALNDSLPMTMKNATVTSVQFLLRSQMGYEAASKASGNDARGFFDSTKLMVQSMLDSITHRLETSMLYGGIGLGISSGTANASATSTVLTFTAATWGMGIWAGAEGAAVDFYNGASILNSNASLIISSVDIDNKAITVTGNSTDITAIDALGGTGAGITVYWKGHYTADMSGIDKIITNTGSLFGISAATYNLWKGNSYGAAGAITLSKLLKSTTAAVGKGLRTEVDCYIAPQNFAVLNAEIATTRSYDQSYSVDKNKTGSKNIALYAQNGMMNIVPHTMVKGGEAFILPTNVIQRIGSTDVTFERFGAPGKFFSELPSNAGFELRNYTDQAIFIDKPAVCTKITGITY